MGAASSSNASGVDAALQVAAPSSTAQRWRADTISYDPWHHLKRWYVMTYANELVMASEILRHFNSQSPPAGDRLLRLSAARSRKIL